MSNFKSRTSFFPAGLYPEHCPGCIFFPILVIIVEFLENAEKNAKSYMGNQTAPIIAVDEKNPVLKANMLHEAIFVATCNAMMIGKHCKLQRC